MKGVRIALQVLGILILIPAVAIATLRFDNLTTPTVHRSCFPAAS